MQKFTNAFAIIVKNRTEINIERFIGVLLFYSLEPYLNYPVV